MLCKLGSERGVALVTALAVMGMMAAVALAFFAMSGSESQMIVQQRIEHVALWKAESGVELSKRAMAEFAKAKLDSLESIWSGTGPIVQSPDTFFPSAGFSEVAADSSMRWQTEFEYVDSAVSATSQTFNFRYVTESWGLDAEFGQKRVVTDGLLRVSATRGSFADYLIFTDIHTSPSGGVIWFHSSGYFDGRVHTNDRFRFAYNPTFMDQVTSAAGDAIYYNNGAAVTLDDDHNGTVDVPTFAGGFERSADSVALPTNAFGQQRAALGGDPDDTSGVTNLEARQHLNLPLTSDPVPPGVYVPNDGTDLTGGIYIEGNASDYRMSVDASGNQVYQITDGASTTTTIVVNETAGTTSVDQGSGPTVYNGVPRGLSYTTGEIERMGGPGRTSGIPGPAVADQTELTVVANGNIGIDDDIVHNDFDDGGSVLGIYSAAGSVHVRTDAPNDLAMDAFVMATGPSGAFEVDDHTTGGDRGDLRLRGGVIQRYYGAFGRFDGSTHLHGYGRDWSYDSRGLVPPYFPTTSRFVVGEPSPLVMAWTED